MSMRFLSLEKRNDLPTEFSKKLKLVSATAILTALLAINTTDAHAETLVEYVEIPGKEVLFLHDGTYRTTCELDSADPLSYLQLRANFHPDDNKQTRINYLQKVLENQIPLNEANLDALFSVKDGEVITTGRRYERPEFNNFSFIAKSQDFKIDDNKDGFKNVLIPNSSEMSYLVGNLTEDQKERLPFDLSKLTTYFNSSYSHTSPKTKSKPIYSDEINNIEKVNFSSGRILRDGHKVHPILKDKLVITGLGFDTLTDIVIDPKSLKGLVTMPAGLILISGGGGGSLHGENSSAYVSVSTVAFKYGTLSCKLYEQVEKEK